MSFYQKFTLKLKIVKIITVCETKKYSLIKLASTLFKFAKLRSSSFHCFSKQKSLTSPKFCDKIT